MVTSEKLEKTPTGNGDVAPRAKTLPIEWFPCQAEFDKTKLPLPKTQKTTPGFTGFQGNIWLHLVPRQPAPLIAEGLGSLNWTEMLMSCHSLIPSKV
mmetsp:Transcript_67733/g.133699  ORF Transcript_67733/g.133699 Transcript_67733/m.133699 type:complete len:97 (+) Transcript_67733:837-1127(+)